MPAPMIHHLALRTRDPERLAAFYEGVFGLERVREQDGHSVWLGLAGGVLMIEAATEGEPTIDRKSYELFALAASAEERAAFRERLGTLGLKTDGETEHTTYLRDPDGRRVGLSSYPFSR